MRGDARVELLLKLLVAPLFVKLETILPAVTTQVCAELVSDASLILSSHTHKIVNGLETKLIRASQITNASWTTTAGTKHLKMPKTERNNA